MTPIYPPFPHMRQYPGHIDDDVHPEVMSSGRQFTQLLETAQLQIIQLLAKHTALTQTCSIGTLWIMVLLWEEVRVLIRGRARVCAEAVHVILGHYLCQKQILDKVAQLLPLAPRQNTNGIISETAVVMITMMMVVMMMTVVMSRPHIGALHKPRTVAEPAIVIPTP